MYLKEVFRLSATPQTLYYPIPLIPFLVFAYTGSDLIYFLKIVIVSFIFSAGINLWNHVNDTLEDKIAGKNLILTENYKLRISIAVLALILYLLSFFAILIWVMDKRGIILFIIVALVTWIYSDKIFFGVKIRRLKENYKTEIIAYTISYPLFTLTLWAIAANINETAIALSFLMLLFGYWNVFLKDIKDASNDELAGLETLAVKFHPETLFKISFVFIMLYYVFIIFFSIFDILPLRSILGATPIIFPIYVIIVSYRLNWTLNENILKPLKILVFSNLFSMFILSILGLF